MDTPYVQGIHSALTAVVHVCSKKTVAARKVSEKTDADIVSIPLMSIDS